MILVGQYDSPYVRRVAISLKLSGLQFTRDTRSVFADAEEMRRINPLGRIPSLVLDDGEVLIDSGAILDHIDELIGPERALLPARGAPRRNALRIVALATGAIDKAGTATYERMLRPHENIYQPWIDRCLTQLASALAALDALPMTPWCLGARPMQPDITIGVMLAYLKSRVTDAFPAGRYPTLEALSVACEALPEFAVTAPTTDEIMPPRGTGSGGHAKPVGSASP